jgi:hypothetical protein
MLTLLLLGITLLTQPFLGGGQADLRPLLFSHGYKLGHELAGFSGRPMLLLFEDTSLPEWSGLPLECEKNPKLNDILSKRVQGIVVDKSQDTDVFSRYGDPPLRTLIIRDLNGPILGILQSEYSIEDLERLLDAVLPMTTTEKSPAYIRLLENTLLLDELSGKNEAEEAARIVRLLKHFEPGSEALLRAEETLASLRIPVQQD